MKIVTKASTLGKGIVHNTQVELKSECDKVFYFYTPQLEKADVEPTYYSPMAKHIPDYIEFIKNNSDKKIGIILESRKDDFSTRDLILEQIKLLDNTNVIIHNLIQK